MAKSFTYKKVKYIITDDGTLSIAKNNKYVGPLVIPESIEKNGIIYRVNAIEKSAFENSKITSVTIPGSIRVISDYAFYRTPLLSVCVSEGTEVIKNGAFAGCASLKDVFFENPNLISVVHASSFEGTKWLSEFLNHYGCLTIGGVLVIVQSNEETYEVQKGINYIAPGAFNKSPSIKEVVFPEGISELPSAVFFQCQSIERVVLPSSLKKICADANVFSPGAFQDCSSLKEIILPEGLETIGANCFRGCGSIEKIFLPKSLRRIGEEAFSNCTALKEISIPNGITKIGEKAFSHCTALKEISIPNGITKIEDKTFEWCTSMESIKLPDTLESIGRYAFGRCYNLLYIAIPGSVKEIGPAAFQQCYNLSKVVLSNGLKIIEGYAFALCNSLNTIQIPNTVDSIENEAFRSCFSLREVIIPKGVAINKNSVFSDCPNLGKATMEDLPAEVTIGILSDPFECNCFVNMTEQDISPYICDKYVEPDEDFFFGCETFVEWGKFRNVTLDKEEVEFNNLFDYPWDDYSSGNGITEALSMLKQGYYAIIDKRLMYKSFTEFHIELNNAPFNKSCLKLLKVDYRGDLRIKKVLMPNESIAPFELLYCGKTVYGEFQFDMGSQGLIQRFVFFKEQNGCVRLIGEYTY